MHRFSDITRRQWLSLAVGGSLMMAASSLALHAYAEDQFVLHCTEPTPSMVLRGHPGADKIVLSNNLARPAGKALDAEGQLLYISGRVVDENCVPIPNAIVDIWQTNPFGHYRWATRDELLNPEPLFAGSGRAVTDNLGRYQFTTLFPGAYGKYAPHINMRVSHPEFRDVNTVMYFRGDRRNGTDPRFRALRGSTQEMLLGDVSLQNPQNPTLGLHASFNITLKGQSAFRGY